MTAPSAEPHSPPVRRALLVTGMHRSGTSALTRTLGLVGGTLASKLIGGIPGDNDLGFWEPAEVVELHDRALASAGSSWDDVSRFPADWFDSDLGAAFADELLALLHREFDGVQLFAVKDPRLCRLAPLWLRVLPRLGVRAQFVMPLRSPVEVAGSLKARDDFPLAKGYLLWLRNVLDAELTTRGQARVFVTYEALLEDWRGLVGHIGKVLGIAWPRLSRCAEAQVEDFLSPGLRRQRADWAEVRGRGDLPGWVVRAHEALLRLAEGDESAEAVLDAVRAELDGADDTYGRALAGMGLRLDAAQSRLGAVARSLAEASAARDAYRQEAERLRGLVASETGRYEAMLQRQREADAGTRGELEAEIERLNLLLLEAQAAFEARLAELYGSSSWRLTRPVRSVGALMRRLRGGGA